jgi:hypothetical protein
MLASLDEKGKPKPRLVGLITDCPDPSKEMFGPAITIVLAMLREAYTCRGTADGPPPPT